MLLALIVMATLTLGLLFSGWLTPTPGKAQPNQSNPQPNQETTDTNCPNYVTNAVVNCPSITNGEVLGPLTFCVQLGSPLPDPTWASQPGATAGSTVTTITETCSNAVTTTTNNISYGFSWHYQTPPGKPQTPTAIGTYTATAIGVITSSDTNDCPSPNAPTWTVTWNVINAGIDAGSIAGTANNGGQTWKVEWLPGLTDIINGSGAGSLFVLSDPSASLYLTHNWWKQIHCCTNGSPGNLNKIWETGTANYNLGGSFDFTAISAFPDWYQDIINYLASLDPGYANQLTTITGFGHFSAGTGTSVNANTKIYTLMEDDCCGCNASYTTGDCQFNANINDSLTSTLFGGVNISVTGAFSSDLTTYGIAITPPDPANQMNIYMQDYITYSLYSFAKIGSHKPGGNYWIQPGSQHIPNPAKVINTVCITPNL